MEASTTRPRGWLHGPWRWGAFVLTLLVLVLAGIWLVWHQVSVRQLEEAEALVREVGLMTELSQLEVSIPDEENAARPLEEAFALLCHPDPGEGYVPNGWSIGLPHPDFERTFLASYDKRKDWPQETWQGFQDVWAAERTASIRELLGLAAQRRYLRFARDHAKGAGMLIPEIGPMRALMKLHVLGVAADAQAGHAERARDTSINFLVVANLYCQRSSTMIDHLVGISCAAIATATMCELAPDLRCASGTKLRTTIHSIDAFRELADALDCEQVIARTAIDSVESPDFTVILDGSSDIQQYMPGPLFRTALIGDKATYLEHMTKAIVSLRSGNAVHDSLPAYHETRFFWKITHMCTLIMLPAIDASYRNTLRRHRDLAFLLTVLDIFAAHDTTGTWPPAMSPLTGQWATIDRSSWTLAAHADGFTLTAPAPPGHMGMNDLIWKFPGGTLATPPAPSDQE